MPSSNGNGARCLQEGRQALTLRLPRLRAGAAGTAPPGTPPAAVLRLLVLAPAHDRRSAAAGGGACGPRLYGAVDLLATEGGVAGELRQLGARMAAEWAPPAAREGGPSPPPPASRPLGQLLMPPEAWAAHFAPVVQDLAFLLQLRAAAAAAGADAGAAEAVGHTIEAAAAHLVGFAAGQAMPQTAALAAAGLPPGLMGAVVEPAGPAPRGPTAAPPAPGAVPAVVEPAGRAALGPVPAAAPAPVQPARWEQRGAAAGAAAGGGPPTLPSPAAAASRPAGPCSLRALLHASLAGFQQRPAVEPAYRRWRCVQAATVDQIAVVLFLCASVAILAKNLRDARLSTCAGFRVLGFWGFEKPKTLTNLAKNLRDVRLSRCAGFRVLGGGGLREQI
jgi:hypothetical protein